MHTAGNCDTAGFIRYRAIYGSVSVYTAYGYGIWGFGYGVGKPDPRYTRVEPYLLPLWQLGTLRGRQNRTIEPAYHSGGHRYRWEQAVRN